MTESVLYDNRFTGRLVADAVLKLFEGDGTLYFATGYFTWSGYLTIRDALVEFLARNPGNEVYIVVSTGADQFSRLVAHALWDLDVDDRLRAFDLPRWLHPSEAVPPGRARAGDGDGLGEPHLGRPRQEPRTGVVLRDGRTRRGLPPHLAWLEAFTAESTPVTTHDLTLRARFRKTAQTWGNKGRINIPSMIRGALPSVALWPTGRHSKPGGTRRGRLDWGDSRDPETVADSLGYKNFRSMG